MYPLNNDPHESQRLKSQFNLLKGEWLSTLFTKPSGRVLDVGCGTGSLTKEVPGNWSYTGIDTHNRFEKKSENHFFIHDDILSLKSSEKYDVIVCRLVLWSLPTREEVLKKLREFSHSSTLLYCYEPDDRGLSFSDELSSMARLAKSWQTTVIPQGCNPFVGGELELLLNRSGWSVLAKKHHVLHHNSLDNGFETHLTNLKRIFSQSNPGPEVELVEEVSAAIEQKKGQFSEKYIELIGQLV